VHCRHGCVPDLSEDRTPNFEAGLAAVSSSQTQIRANSNHRCLWSRTSPLLDQKRVSCGAMLTATSVSQNADTIPPRGIPGRLWPRRFSSFGHTGSRVRISVALPRGSAEAKARKRRVVRIQRIAADLFPELWNAVVTTDWPAFMVNAPCKPPAPIPARISGQPGGKN